MTGFFKSTAIAAFAAVLGFGANASFATNNTPLVPAYGPQATINSGDTYQGWTITYPEGMGVSLAQDATTNQLELVVEKFATFVSSNSYLITFTQNKAWSGTPVATSIDIQNESITNFSGSNWNQFNFELQTPFTGPSNLAAAFTPGHEFVPPSGPNGSWSGVTFSSTDISYTGSQPNGTVSLWGQTQTANDDLLIATNPGTGQVPQSFTFKELPSVSVPVPAAAWSGLTGLLGLGLVAYGKNLKKILA
jgi:hypothetical protein